MAYFNPSWVEFGLANGNTVDQIKSALGENVLVRWPSVMATKFMSVFNQVLSQTEPMPEAPPSIRYLCHSPDRHREFSMDIFPLPDAAGLLIINHQVVDKAHENLEVRLNEQAYQDQTGYITQCANCSKVRHPGNHNRWDLVTAYIERPILKTSHAICRSCQNNYLLLNQ